VRKPGGEFGTRCEIKNVNSIRFIGQAIEYEARRQIDILEDGGSDRPGDAPLRPGKGETRSMRSKEEAHDYRYFPDPDLLPLEFDQALSTIWPSTCRNCRTTRRRASSPSTA
jgi:aspartyl-tRNA(Asn)/glutamyl-tRNA(Gln) amidotransferase subunit B